MSFPISLFIHLFINFFTHSFIYSFIYLFLLESKIRKLSVLLVEDTLSQQKLMSKWLHGQGCEVVCAVNGKIGLELLKTKQFDIAFIDFLMVRRKISFCLSGNSLQ